MKNQRMFPLLTALLCIPGTIVCALHWMQGFDFATGLPTYGSHTFAIGVAFFVACAVLYFALSRGLSGLRDTSYETLFGCDKAVTKAVLVSGALLMLVGGVLYFYFVMNHPVEVEQPSWMEWLYAISAILAAYGWVQIARNKNQEITKQAATFWTLPLFFSCVHLLVEYRLNCTDPRLTAIAISLLGAVCAVFAHYHFAKLLFGKPSPRFFAFFTAMGTTMMVSNSAGYLAARLLGMRAITWNSNEVVRTCLLVVSMLMLLYQLILLTRTRTGAQENK